MTDAPKRADWNREYGDAADHMGLQLINAYSPRIDEVAAKQNGEYMAVIEDRSSLQLDDRYVGAWRGASLSAMSMGAALDSLQTLRALVLEAKVIPMTGLYPTLRAVVENAALAVYLLAPRERDERLRRTYRVAADETRLRRVFELEIASRKVVTSERVQATKDAKEKSDRIHAELIGMVSMRPSLGDPAKFTFPRVHFSTLVSIASDVLDADPSLDEIGSEMSLLAMWQLLSGLSHGKQWAMVAVLERTRAIVNERNCSAHVRLTTSPAVIAVFLERALQTLECAYRLYGRRSKAAWAEP